MKLSIVTTLYRSEAFIEEFYRQSKAAAQRLVADDFEIIFVNNGSPDESLNTAKALAEHDPHVLLIDLARNFGHHRAMMTGFLSLGAGRCSWLTAISRNLRSGC